MRAPAYYAFLAIPATMLVAVGLALALVAIVVSFGLLVLGAPLSRWGLQWPILSAALLVTVGGILRSGPAGSRGPTRAVLAAPPSPCSSGSSRRAASPSTSAT